jgi:hypothetical protein
MPRVFETNEGWEVTLVHSYVTTTAVSLVSCEGEEVPLRMFWGPCPEDLHLEDLRAFTVAGLEVPSGYYCQLLVQYGPYVLPTELEREEEARHDVPDDEEIANATTYIRGAAKRPGDVDNIPFEIRSKAKFVVAMDLDDFSADDEPFYVDGTEDLPLELTVSKMYDRFFDDLDFSAIEGSELNSAVNGALRRQTRAWPGSKISETASQ